MTAHECPSRVRFAGIEHVCVCAPRPHHALCTYAEPLTGRETCPICAVIPKIKAHISKALEEIPVGYVEPRPDEDYELVLVLPRREVLDVVANA